jgi:eukaryotic-like serine/threonine-protein kinase
MDEAFAALRIAVPGSAALPGGCARDEHVKAALGDSSLRAQLISGPRLSGRHDYLIRFPSSKHARGAWVPTATAEIEGTRLLGRYMVGQEIGEGGAGTVYEATDERTGEQVVVKLFKPILARSAAALQQCFNEARTCARLAHPNVVRLLDFGHTDEGRPLLVMERLAGVPLRAVLNERGSLDPLSTCRIGRDIAAALDAAHAAGVIHRDVKPRNIILVEPRPARAKLIDFGIALDLETLEHGAVDRSGTPLYFSPEQLRRHKPSPKSDLYALGLTLYECLLGALPHANLPPAIALELRATEPLPPVDTLLTTPLPGLLGYVVDRCLAIHPDDRLASAAEVKELLDES